VTLVVIFTVGIVLFVLNKKRKRYVLLNSLQFNEEKKRKEDRHDLYLYRQSILEDDVLSNSSYGPFDCNMNVSIFF